MLNVIVVIVLILIPLTVLRLRLGAPREVPDAAGRFALRLALVALLLRRAPARLPDHPVLEKSQ